jgi:hypothetical protein
VKVTRVVGGHLLGKAEPLKPFRIRIADPPAPELPAPRNRAERRAQRKGRNR